MGKKTDSKKALTDHLKGVEIMPLKDDEIHHNHHHIFIKEGELISIPRMFLQNMLTKGVIDKLPKEG